MTPAATGSTTDIDPFGPGQARRFYDRFGERQDRQGWYEDAALERLVALSRFETAHRVVELGCGTGRLAARLLAEHLPADATYRGFDLSETMVELAAERLRAAAPRATVERVGGEPPLPVEDGGADRFVSTYVLDLLSLQLIDRTLDDAHRVLEPGGLLCVAGITAGTGPVSRLLMATWSLVRRLRPTLVGGCRPLRVAPRLASDRWTLLHCERVAPWGLASEVLVAARSGP